MSQYQTGVLITLTLIEIDGITGLPTGNSKPNVSSDPDYIPPIIDTETCPIGAPPEGDFSDDFNNDFNN